MLISSRASSTSRAFFAAAAFALAAPSGAQAPAAASAPEVGQMAPDFALPGATRYGVLRDSIRLSGFRGETVVLAFFSRARTKG